MKNIFSKHQPPSLLINAMGVDAKVGKDNNSFKEINKQDGASFNNALQQGITSYFLTSKYFVLEHKKTTQMEEYLILPQTCLSLHLITGYIMMMS